jgi:hypothetical protein
LGRKFTAILVTVVGFLATRADAAFLTNPPAADTTLIGIAPTNNNGAQAWLLAGRIQNNYTNRALFRFDFSNLPTNALILSAALNLEVTRVPAETPISSNFGLRRMLRPWGEGSKAADGTIEQPPGQGRPATAGEATWLHAFFSTNAWSTPGGAEGLDFSGVESSFQFVGGIGSYRFESTPELVADVQQWVDHPEFNYGWMLICGDEQTIFTARRFASREDPDAHPTLEVEFFASPLVESAARVGGQFALTFTAWQGQSYLVEFRDSLTIGQWQTLTNLGLATATTQHSVTDSISQPRRFYRLVTY